MGRRAGEAIISLRHEKMAERKRRRRKITSCICSLGPSKQRGGRTGGGSFQMYAATRGLPHTLVDVIQVRAGEVDLSCEWVHTQ